MNPYAYGTLRECTDSLIFLESSELVLHLEFQTQPDESIPFRMTDYRLRLYRKFPNRQIHQVVIYLTPSTSQLVYQNTFDLPELTHRFNAIRLWEQPTEVFQSLGLMPFAVLSQTTDKTETLRQIAQKIDNITDRRVQSNLAAATAIVAGLALNKAIVQQLLRSEIMKESVIYQEILQEGEARGEARGKAEGKAEKTRQIAINMLQAGLAVDLIAEVTGLTVEQINTLRSSQG